MINAFFSENSLRRVKEMLYAEAGQPPAEPCPPKEPPQPKPPPQPAPPPQPQSIPATQTDQQTQQQEQRLKKPKCIPQAQQTVDHSETFDFTRCVRPNGTAYGTGGKCRKGTESPYKDWETLAKGNFGEVKVNPQKTRVVKTLLSQNGQKGEFGEFEVELAKKMGELGHSPKIHSHSEDHIEMDLAKGNTLWKNYVRGKGEPRMTAAQATKAAQAIHDLHKMGFAHGDLHALQFLVNGDDVKLVDFGLSVPTSRQPSRVMQDLSKIDPLVNWKNPELANNPYVQLVNKHLDRYKEVKGVSKAAQAKRVQIGRDYLSDLEKL
jgi:hypothetical protein